MGKIRFGYSDDFTAKNSSVGINTTEPQQNLDVIGVVKGKDLAVPGISSLTAYEGFLRADYQVAENTTLRFDQGSSASLSGEIIVGTGQTVTVSKVEDEFANANDGTVWSAYLSNSAGGFQAAYPASQAFNGKISATETSRSVNSQITSTWTPPKGITYSSSVEVWTYYAGSVSLNGGTAITVNNDQSWRTISSGSGTLTSITFSSNSGNSVYIAGIAIDGEILVDGFSTPVDKGARAGGSEIECLKVFNTFTPPSGGTNERPYAPKPGELYYNYDLKTIEFFDGNGWRQVDNTTRSGRMLAGGGSGPSNQTTIESINIPSRGNAQNFGDLSLARTNVASCSSATRGIWVGGIASAYNDTMDYVTIASGGLALDFGNIMINDSNTPPNRVAGNRAYVGATSSSTRGVFGGGYQSSPLPNATTNIIDYIQMSTLGDTLDFGDLFTGRYSSGAVSNGIKAVWGGGAGPGTPSDKSDLQSVNIASLGNATRFGDLTYNRINAGGATFSSNVRGVFAGGRHPTTVRGIDYITIASEGNAVYFGDLTVARQRSAGSSTQIRGVWAGGNTPSNQSNVIDYVNIATTGDAVDFGDATKPTGSWDGCSDSHGGLGGF